MPKLEDLFGLNRIGRHFRDVVGIWQAAPSPTDQPGCHEISKLRSPGNRQQLAKHETGK
jgi:hypothetical protein